VNESGRFQRQRSSRRVADSCAGHIAQRWTNSAAATRRGFPDQRHDAQQGASRQANDGHRGGLRPDVLSESKRTATWRCERHGRPQTYPARVRKITGLQGRFYPHPWRGKSPQDCPDGPRYKALGNSMAVPCMAWIGKRIAAQHQGQVRYLSVCSGIEAASVAWEPLGWEPAAFAEVEKFPSAVLAHHWPQVPNLGDMTRHESWNLGAIDLLVGGTPCQSFSVAGLRKGLHDPRGGLMLTFLEIAQRQRPRWIVWENVPGVLSSHGGRDFGAFLGALGALGYGWAYRVLDAQWFGVAQRRRRVFVVGCLGDGAAAATVLFESESVCRNPAPSREKRQGVAADATGGIGGGRRGGCADVSTVDARNKFDRGDSQHLDRLVCDPVQTLAMRESGQGYWMQDELAGPLRAEGENRPSRPSSVIASGLPEIVGTLSDGAHQGGGLTDKMHTRAAYSPALANPLTARMGKGINTTLDEGQTAIVEGK
jgi:site-specific DNA-cytosine methylase